MGSIQLSGAYYRRIHNRGRPLPRPTQNVSTHSATLPAFSSSCSTGHATNIAPSSNLSSDHAIGYADGYKAGYAPDDRQFYHIRKPDDVVGREYTDGYATGWSEGSAAKPTDRSRSLGLSQTPCAVATGHVARHTESIPARPPSPSTHVEPVHTQNHEPEDYEAGDNESEDCESGDNESESYESDDVPGQTISPQKGYLLWDYINKAWRHFTGTDLINI